MLEFVDQDLAYWRVERWYELRISVDERGSFAEVLGYFTDKNLANVAGKKKGFYERDGKAFEVLVLTKDGEAGFIVKPEQIKLSKQDSIRVAAIAKAKSKLSEEEKKLLGIK